MESVAYSSGYSTIAASCYKAPTVFINKTVSARGGANGTFS